VLVAATDGEVLYNKQNRRGRHRGKRLQQNNQKQQRHKQTVKYHTVHNEINGIIHRYNLPIHQIKFINRSIIKSNICREEQHVLCLHNTLGSIEKPQ
jgi:hypothetical protein